MSFCAGSLTGRMAAFQAAGGGSSPTPALQNIRVDLCALKDIRNFVEKYHYSHSVNGVKISHCFQFTVNKFLIGAAIFGQLSTTAWKKFGECESDVLELRRLVCLDDTPKNTESRCIAIMLRWLKRNTDWKIVVSYADTNFGHSGVIYRASNFVFVGESGKDKGFKDPSTGKVYHSRALRTKYNGDFKPFVKKLRAKLERGELIPIELKPKLCFTYRLASPKHTLFTE